ncbi:MAG: OprO/OprP family phosphate-selective porin [Bacteroidaceae bacterium]|nr:OprO/OprP family phosphate-selective porin [Bacteroidaceae bacterium]
MNKVKVSIFTLLLSCGGAAMAQTMEERIANLEEKLQSMTDKQKYAPQIHGILRGKYEYQPDLEASRFEVRNARLSAEGNLSHSSAYKLEVDLCDESAIKMKDAWVRINPYKSLRVTLGQQRMPFSIDAHRNPSAQYFANRSFIAKQVGDMRDVGAAVGASILLPREGQLIIDAGIYNGSNLDNQKTAWFDSPAYSARIQYLPIKGLAFIPSVQHQLIANREASYTSLDFGAYYESSGFHIEAEYLRKFYAHNAFDDCNAIDAMAIYKMPMRKGYLNGISYLLRYDYMDNHSDGKKGFAEGTTRLQQSDAERHRLTAGLTFHVANKYFPTDIRLNYEKYWYPNNGTPKESEQDKLVAELMIKF